MLNSNKKKVSLWYIITIPIQCKLSPLVLTFCFLKIYVDVNIR